MVRLGQVGTGSWGRRIIATLNALDGVRLTRLASRAADAASLVAAECTVSRDWRDLMAAGDLDGVIVATPPASHAGIAGAALDAGLGVLIEKPLTLDPTESGSLLRRAHARAGIAQVDHIHLFQPAYAALKARVRTAGGARLIRSYGGNQGPFRDDTPALWDYGAHDVALAIDLMDATPSGIACRRLDGPRPGAPGSGVFEIVLSFSGRRRAEIVVGNLLPGKARWLDVLQTGGSLRFDDLAEDKLVWRPDGGPATPIPVSSERPLSRCLRRFADALATGAPDVADLALGDRVVRVLAACDARLAKP